MLICFVKAKSQTPTITADGPLNFCYGENVILCVNPEYSHYYWNTGSISRCVTITQSGSYMAVMEDSLGNVDSTLMLSPVVVTVHNPIPEVSVSGDSLFVTTTYSSYQWYRNDTLIDNATNQYYIAIQSGNYTIEVTDSFGCSGRNFNMEYPDDFEGIEEYYFPFSFSPNPATTHFILTSPQKAHISITNILGVEVMKTEINVGKIQINTSDFAKGIYYVKVGGLVRKLMVE